MNPLSALHADIDARAQAIRGCRDDWPCRKGCDRCCRQLSGLPRLTETEWNLLRNDLAALPPKRLDEIRRDAAALSATASRPFVCPMLDRVAGTCSTYAGRPVACRTYGFYVQRNLGMYCADIQSRSDRGELPDVVWGNHDAVDLRLAALGEARDLTQWFACWAHGA